MKNCIILFFLIVFAMSTDLEVDEYFDRDGHETEYYSWDLKPIDPYEYTEIIIDPYASQEDQSPSVLDPWSSYRSDP